MPFSEYRNIEDVIGKYPLEITSAPFLKDIEIPLPDLFLENLNFALARKTAQDNEFFLTENFIYPFLQLVWKRHEKLRLWSHHLLRYDDDLSGEPDYFLSYWPGGVIRSLISLPMLAVVEAKKQDFDKGWGQCLAGMLACQKINNNENLTVYGIVSTGILWEFGKLKNSQFTWNTISYSLSNPRVLAGILDELFHRCEKGIEEYRRELPT
uniref:Uncharacterized protein n=1 Tax=Candidatus Kentrum sp. MB TaxID=2138164 RepID=A0A451B9V7_9GAMM|nr:MAG: hypothetical protein BECKMB1821I_GA0114274_100262 [Candidatus Kentron sp. MB]VFK75074.1 MAG: hypothetical protein BECKMB1821H_GA0114242_101511 [Candidatus Kentron sp. MB]